MSLTHRCPRLWAPALMLVIASPAAAERLAVLDLNFEATAPALQTLVRKRLHRALAASGYEVVTEGPGLPLQTLSKRCKVGPCLSRIGQRANAPLAFIGGIVGQGASYDITLTLLETSSGTVVAQVSDRCNVCTFDEAASAAVRGVPSLSVQAERVIANQAWLVVQSTPSGAEVQVDQVPLGATPLRRLVSPGRHALVVTHTKWPAHRRTIELTPGTSQTVSLDLTAKPKAQRRPAPSKPGGNRSSTVQWVTFASSLALTTAGTVLLALHEDCSDPPVCSERRNTATVGLVLASAGLVATLLSGYWLWSSRPGPPPRKAVGAAPHANGLTLVYLGTF